jgi:hypothetical protein
VETGISSSPRERSHRHLILTLLCGVLFLYCTCKCCACCRPILDLSTFVFKGIWKLLTGMVKCCRKSRDHDDILLGKTSGKTDEVVWEVEVVDERLILFAELNSGIIYYNSIMDVVENGEG